jgi:hypothetical protein
MAADKTPGPSGTCPDQYFEDISADELSANAPTAETNDDKNAQRERNRKRNERPSNSANRVHTTPEQCLMSITMIPC